MKAAAGDLLPSTSLVPHDRELVDDSRRGCRPAAGARRRRRSRCCASTPATSSSIADGIWLAAVVADAMRRVRVPARGARGRRPRSGRSGCRRATGICRPGASPALDNALKYSPPTSAIDDCAPWQRLGGALAVGNSGSVIPEMRAGARLRPVLPRLQCEAHRRHGHGPRHRSPDCATRTAARCRLRVQRVDGTTFTLSFPEKERRHERRTHSCR